MERKTTLIQNYLKSYFLENPIKSIVATGALLGAMIVFCFFNKINYFPSLSNDVLYGLLGMVAFLAIFLVVTILSVLVLGTMIFKWISTILYKPSTMKMSEIKNVKTVFIWFFIPVYVLVLLFYGIMVILHQIHYEMIILVTTLVILLLFSILRTFIRKETWSQCFFSIYILVSLYLLTLFIPALLIEPTLHSTTLLKGFLSISIASLLYLIFSFIFSLFNSNDTKKTKQNYLALLLMIALIGIIYYSNLIMNKIIDGPSLSHNQSFGLLIDKVAIKQLETLTGETIKAKHGFYLVKHFHLLTNLGNFMRIKMETKQDCPPNQICYLTFNLNKAHASLVVFTEGKSN